LIAVMKLLPEPLRQMAHGLLFGGGETARAGRGALIAFAIRVLSAAIVFLSQVALARWMGAHEFGIFTTAWVWIAILGTLASLGFSTTVIRFLAAYREQRQFDLFRGFLRAGRTIACLTGLAVAGCGYTLIFTGAADAEFEAVMMLALLCLPAYALTDFQDGVGRAQGWIDLALLPPYVLRPLLLFGFVAASLWLGGDRTASSAAWAAIAATWVTACIQYFLQRRRMAGVVPDGVRSYDTGHWLRQSLPVLMLDGFALLMLNLDILILNLFVTPDQTGIYFAAIRTISLVSFVHFSVTAVAMPRFAKLHAEGRHADIYPVLKDMQKWTFWPSAAGVAGLLTLGYPLLWLFGPEFTAAYPVMFILAAGLLLQALAGPAQSLLVVTGHQNATAITMVLSVFLNAALNLMLIPRFGIVGAAMATAAAFMLQSVAMMVLAQRYFATSSRIADGRLVN
jgi:O-antigen/teichoic acid export membrane protein